MIRLVKGPVPPVLAQSSQVWTQVLRERAERNEAPTTAEATRYRHADVKTALLAETSGKCAYCESKVRHVTYGDVEHIVPKSVDILKTYQWSNLTLACDVCNTNKGAHFGNHEDLVDPYAEDPENHFDFLGAVVLPKPHSVPGMITEETIRLNRIELMERRKDRLQALLRELQLYARMTDANERAVLRRSLETVSMSAQSEYTAMARAYVSQQLARIDLDEQAR